MKLYHCFCFYYSETPIDSNYKLTAQVWLYTRFFFSGDGCFQRKILTVRLECLSGHKEKQCDTIFVDI